MFRKTGNLILQELISLDRGAVKALGFKLTAKEITKQKGAEK